MTPTDFVKRVENLITDSQNGSPTDFPFNVDLCDEGGPCVLPVFVQLKEDAEWRVGGGLDVAFCGGSCLFDFVFCKVVFGCWVADGDYEGPEFGHCERRLVSLGGGASEAGGGQRKAVTN